MSDDSSPSRLRAKLLGARGEAVAQRAPELQAHLSSYGWSASNIAAGGNLAVIQLLNMPGCPTINLLGTQEEAEKQMVEVANFCRELMPVAKYLSAFSECAGIASRSDEAAVEELKAAVTRFMEDTPFHPAQESTDGYNRLLLSYAATEAMADVLLAYEGMAQALQTNQNTLVWLSTNGGSNLPVIKKLVEAGAPITNVAPYSESFLSNMQVNYDAEAFTWALSKSTKEHIDFVRPNYGYGLLETAIRNNRVEQALELIALGAQLFSEIYGATGFNGLVSGASDDTVQRLLAADAVKEQLAPKLTHLFALTTSVNAYPSDSFLTALRDAGAALNEDYAATSALGYRPALCTFVSNSNAAALRKMMEFGADVVTYKADTSNGTLLFLAQSAEVADILIAAGIDINAVNDAGNTALMSAIQCYYSAVIPSLFTAATNIHIVNTYGQTLLIVAVSASNMDVVRGVLAREDASKVINVANSGWTALHTACSNGNVDLVTALLEAGADANLVLEDGQTPLMLAASNPAIVALLLPKTADINARDNSGRTALWKAASGYQIDCVTALLDAGADANIADNDNATTLLAFLCGGCALDVAVLNRLLAAVTDASATRTSDGYSPGLAVLNNRNTADTFATVAADFMARGLITYKSADSTTNAVGYLFRAVTYNESVIMPLIAELLAKAKEAGELEAVLTQNIANDTVLHYAAYRGTERDDAFNKAFVTFLDAAPSLIENARPSDGRTPLLVAAAGNNPGAVEILIERGANVEAKDSNGQGGLEVTTTTRIIEQFLKKGLKINWETFNAACLADQTFVDLIQDQIADLKPTAPMLIAAIDNNGDNFLMTFVNKALEEKTLNVNTEVNGQTAVHRIAYAGNYVDDTQYVWLQKLIAAGADVNLVRTDGATPLIEALRGSNRGAMALLLADASIDVNKMSQGETPLTYAVANGKAQEFVEQLLAKGADKTKANEAGKLAHELTSDEAIKALVAV